LAVVPRAHFSKAWLLSVIASGIIACTTPETVRYLAHAYSRNLAPHWWDRTMVIHYQSIGFLLALIALVLYRHRFARLQPWLQWLIAGIFLMFALVHGMIRWQWMAW
jgi:hypothetical protein